MKAFVRTFFATFISLLLLMALVGGVALMKFKKKVKIKDRSYLVVDIYGEIMEYDPPDGISRLFGAGPETLTRVLDNLAKAEVDERIKGVIVRVASNNTAGLAKLQEMRDAIKGVRKAGKDVYAFSEMMDRNALYLASACDSIFMPPTGDLFFTGLVAGRPHVKRALEKMGIKPNIHKIKEYKSAAELVTREDMSPEAREMTRWILEEFWELELSGIAQDRGLGIDSLQSLMERALFTAEEARRAGLIDGLAYWSDLKDKLKEEGDEKLRTVSQADYARVEPEKVGLKGKKKIAVVHAQGMIGGRKSRINPFFGVMMGHESVVADLRRAMKDDDVAAVIFRVDSPGGEGLTSDIIGHQVEIVAGKKPVVVSMVDVAASGGYDISYRATRIVADPLTLTGSIGSISGKFNMKGFYDKLGITFDYVTKGPMALIWSGYRDFTPEERKRFEENHWAFFNFWFHDIAEHRGIDPEKLKSLAYGRVWSGRQAASNGLVDELGGLDRAVELAKELAGMAKEEKVTLVHYPQPSRGFLAMLNPARAASLLRWAGYRLIHCDLLSVVRSMTSQPMLLMEPVR